MRPFEGFQRKAIVICPTDEDLKERTLKQTDVEGKDVPDHAVLEMKANFVLPERGEFLDEVDFVELQRDEAEKLVKEYNEEGRRAAPPPEKRYDNRQSGYRGQSSSFQHFENRGGPRGGYQNRGGSGGGYRPGPGFKRGGYNQNGWGGNYRDNSSRGGYNRNQNYGGSYNSSNQGSYSKEGYTQSYNQAYNQDYNQCNYNQGSYNQGSYNYGNYSQYPAYGQGYSDSQASGYNQQQSYNQQYQQYAQQWQQYYQSQWNQYYSQYCNYSLQQGNSQGQ